MNKNEVDHRKLKEPQCNGAFIFPQQTFPATKQPVHSPFACRIRFSPVSTTKKKCKIPKHTKKGAKRCLLMMMNHTRNTARRQTAEQLQVFQACVFWFSFSSKVGKSRKRQSEPERKKKTAKARMKKKKTAYFRSIKTNSPPVDGGAQTATHTQTHCCCCKRMVHLWASLSVQID